MSTTKGSSPEGAHRPIVPTPIVAFGISVGFIALVAAANKLVLLSCSRLAIDCPTYWPVSVCYPNQPWVGRPFAAAAVVGLFLLALKLLPKVDYKLPHVILAGLLL